MVTFHPWRATLWSRIWQLGLLVALFPAGAGWAASPPAVSLEQALQQAAPQIIQQLQVQGCRKVGVLKFRVCTGRTVSDSRGTLNSYLADRLETALILANPLDEAKQLRLIQQASAVASKTLGASHLSLPGRERLFSAVYQPAWGHGELHVDAFVTGVVQVAPDFRTVRVSFLAVKAGDKDLVMLTKPIVAATNGAILNELGESYQLRGGGPQSPADAVREVRSDPEANFPVQSDQDVLLQVLYDGQPVDFDCSSGEALIREPREGQAVSLRIERRNDSDAEFGAVLKVNGESVLFRQREPDIECAKYLLKPGSAPITVDGYQLRDDEAEAFSVASRADSEKLEMYYGPDVGTISLTVFRTATGPVSDLPPDLAAIAKAGVPIEGIEDLPSLQKQLREEASGVRTRGVLTPGERIRRKIDWEGKRVWEPEPFLSAVIRYYRPTGTP